MESAQLNRFPEEDLPGLCVLDIGCGEHKIPGAIGCLPELQLRGQTGDGRQAGQLGELV